MLPVPCTGGARPQCLATHAHAAHVLHGGRYAPPARPPLLPEPQASACSCSLTSCRRRGEIAMHGPPVRPNSAHVWVPGDLSTWGVQAPANTPPIVLGEGSPIGPHAVEHEACAATEGGQGRRLLNVHFHHFYCHLRLRSACCSGLPGGGSCGAPFPLCRYAQGSQVLPRLGAAAGTGCHPHRGWKEERTATLGKVGVHL